MISNRERFLYEAAESLLIIDWFIQQVISDKWIVKLNLWAKIEDYVA